MKTHLNLVLCVCILLFSVSFFIHKRFSQQHSVFPKVTLKADGLQEKEKEIILNPKSIQYKLVENGTATSVSMSSLEMRENVDFLLTPGLLVQESITNEAVLTYPEE